MTAFGDVGSGEMEVIERAQPASATVMAIVAIAPSLRTVGIYITSTGRRNVAERACPRLSALWQVQLRVAFRMKAWTLVTARGVRGAHETDTRAAVGDGKRHVILLRLQVDVLDEQRKHLSLRTPVPAVWLQLATFAPTLKGVATLVHSRDQDFRVEAKGLEPSNLLTARWFNTVAARVRSSRTVAFWLVQTAVQRVVCNDVQLRATLRDGFVGSNVGFSFGGRRRPTAVLDGWLSSRAASLLALTASSAIELGRHQDRLFPEHRNNASPNT